VREQASFQSIKSGLPNTVREMEINLVNKFYSLSSWLTQMVSFPSSLISWLLSVSFMQRILQIPTWIR